MRATIARSCLLLLCALARLFRGDARVREGSAPKRVLVVQMAKLGDMVCTTPVFRAIKNVFPEIFLAVLGNKTNREVLSGNRDVDEYLVFDGLWSVYRKMRCGTFDTIVIPVPDFVSAALAYLSLAPHIIVPRVIGGYSPLETLWYRSLRPIAGFSCVPHRMRHYAPGEYLRLLEMIGIHTSDTTKHLAFSEKARERAQELLQKEEGALSVGISPSAGDKIKIWGSDHFAVLSNMLSRRFGARIIVFGAPADKEEVERMLKGLDSATEYLDLSLKISIEEMKAAIATLDLFVSSDTGPVYIAEAFGVPTVAIAGPVDENEQVPRGGKHRVVVPSGERVPQMFIMNGETYDPMEVKRQIESVTPEMVYEACAALLEKKNREDVGI